MDRIRVGFVGTGRISDLHAIEYLSNPHAEIVALCDRDASLAERRARVWGLDSPLITDDYHELVGHDTVDLVEVLLPHHLHLEATLAALEAGKAVSVQKPMCTSVADADRMMEAARGAPGPLRVFENFVFYPPVVQAKSLIDEGAIGEPLTIRIKSNPGRSETEWDVPAASRAWRQDVDQIGGGPLVLDDGHHKFALAWYFMGPAEEVHAWISHTTAPDGFVFDAPSMVSFRFPGNRYGNLEIVYSPGARHRDRALRAGRPDRDHRHPGSHLDQPRARAARRRRRSRPALPRRGAHRLPRRRDGVGDELRVLDPALHRGAAKRESSRSSRERTGATSCASRSRPRSPPAPAPRSGSEPPRARPVGSARALRQRTPATEIRALPGCSGRSVERPRSGVPVARPVALDSPVGPRSY